MIPRGPAPDPVTPRAPRAHALAERAWAVQRHLRP